VQLSLVVPVAQIETRLVIHTSNLNSPRSKRGRALKLLLKLCYGNFFLFNIAEYLFLKDKNDREKLQWESTGYYM